VKKWFIPLVILLVLTFVISGCSSAAPTTTAAATTTAVKTTAAATTTAAKTTVAAATTTAAPTVTPKKGGALKIIDTGGPTNSLGWLADPTVLVMAMWCSPMFEALLQGDNNGNFQPCLAESWEIAPDMLSVTLHLRKGVKFHDGSDFNAEAVKWNFDVCIAAKLAKLADYKSVDVIDPLTVKINLKQYTNTLMSDLTTNWMVSKAAFDKAEADHAKDPSKPGGADYLRWNPVGTGPFKFVEYKRDAYMKWVKFDQYWQPGKPYLDAIEMDFVSDAAVRSAALLSGSVDAEGGVVSQQDAAIVKDTTKYRIETGYDASMALVPDSANLASPYSILEVRQAVDYAIDRDAITKARGFGYWTPIYQWAVPNTYSWVKDLQPRAFNPAKAKELLKTAGYPTGFETTIYGNPDLDTRVAIQGYLSDVGIKAKLVESGTAEFVAMSNKGWTNGMLISPSAFGANHNKMFSYNLSQSAMSFHSLFKPDDIEKMVIAAKATKDIDPALTQKWVKAMFDQVDTIPLYATLRGCIMMKYVKGTNFFMKSSFIIWTPADTWLDK